MAGSGRTSRVRRGVRGPPWPHGPRHRNGPWAPQRCVGPVEPDREEEWRAPFRESIQLFTRLRRSDAIRLLFIRALHRQPAQRPPIPSRLQGVDAVFLSLVPSVRVDRPVPGMAVIDSRCANRARVVIVENLADSDRFIPALPEALAQRHHIRHGRAEIHIVLSNPGLVGIQPGHEGGPRWSAQRVLAMGVGEHGALLGQAVQIRRLDQGVTVRPEGTIQVVRHDEQDVHRTSLCIWCVGRWDIGCRTPPQKRNHHGPSRESLCRQGPRGHHRVMRAGNILFHRPGLTRSNDTE